LVVWAAALAIIAGCSSHEAARNHPSAPHRVADRIRTVVDGSSQYSFYTHCGIEWTLINGHYWHADQPLSDGNGNPPPGWGNPFQVGTLTVIDQATAEFESSAGSVTFRRTDLTEPPFLCS
jgi:hypothetical protein